MEFCRRGGRRYVKNLHHPLQRQQCTSTRHRRVVAGKRLGRVFPGYHPVAWARARGPLAVTGATSTKLGKKLRKKDYADYTGSRRALLEPPAKVDRRRSGGAGRRFAIAALG